MTGSVHEGAAKTAVVGMIDPAKLEFHGRMFLWENAIYRTRVLLRIAERARDASNEPERYAQLDERNKRFREFIEQQPDYQPGKVLHTQCLEFDKQFQEPFGHLTECWAIKNACANLASVYFCQIFNRGFEDPGVAAGNTKEFRESHLPGILEYSFPKPEDLAAFNKLNDKLLTARDKMIGHADAASYNIQHGYPASQFQDINCVVTDDELDHWISCMRAINSGLRSYLIDISAV